MDLTGRTLGPYDITEKLGEGGMGAVYRATHRYLNRTVALKILPPELARDSDFAARFLREGQAVAALEHPHIVPIYEAGEIEGFSFLAMRYINGQDLAKRIAERGPLPLQETIELLAQAAAALDAAHQAGIIHRDIKPSNLMIENRHVYLTDFGIAKSDSGDFKTRTGTIIGTPEFMAPEQIQGLPIDRRADVYALGVVAYQMLSGQVPYAAPTPAMVIYRKLSEPVPDIRTVRGDLPPGVAGVLARAMAPRAEERFATAGEFVSALRAAAQGDAATYVVAPPAGQRPQTPYPMPQSQHPTYPVQQPPQPPYPMPQPQHPTYPVQQPQPPFQTPYPVQQPHKKNKLPIFLGIGGVLLILIALVTLFGSSDSPGPSARTTPTSVAGGGDRRPAAEPTTVRGPVGSEVVFNTYHASEGDYTIDYPEDWTVNEEPPNVQFLAPNEEALVQVTYSDIGGTLSQDQLVDIASESLADGFGDGYVEEDRVPQADGSTRIDFRIEEQTELTGSVWVEQHGTKLYMLLMMVETTKSSEYTDIFNHILSSYSIR
ncbi:MAG: hypothetical protein KatS3mg057_2790 [Herpetosiphonaceae bacterium]|nr:MAG: hypothetical protein KatS3mg057_2790 [Herpetosiphonaceae bacterium]